MWPQVSEATKIRVVKLAHKLEENVDGPVALLVKCQMQRCHSLEDIGIFIVDRLGIVVLNLVKQLAIKLLEVLQNVIQLNWVIDELHVVKESTLVDYKVKLLFVKNVLIMLMRVMLLHFKVDHEGHIAET